MVVRPAAARQRWQPAAEQPHLIDDTALGNQHIQAAIQPEAGLRRVAVLVDCGDERVLLEIDRLCRLHSRQNNWFEGQR